MIAFIEEHREVYGVEPICRVLPIAPATFHRHAAIARKPELASDRARQDKEDFEEIRRVYDKSRGRYGARKVWHQLRRDKHDIARCTVERLMRDKGLQGVTRGKTKTTVPDPAQPCPDDKVNRQFTANAPNELWVSDFTYVSTWMGMVYVAFIIDVFARKIVGWRVSTSMTTSFVLDALNQAIAQRCPAEGGRLIHHSDRGSQYLSIRYTERLADAGIGQPFGVADGQVLAAAIGMMDQATALGRAPLGDGLVQRIENKAGGHRCRDAPAHNLAREDIDDEGHVDHPHPGRHVGEVGYPELVGGICCKLPVDLVIRAGLRRIGDRGLRLAARNAL